MDIELHNRMARVHAWHVDRANKSTNHREKARHEGIAAIFECIFAFIR